MTEVAHCHTAELRNIIIITPCPPPCVNLVAHSTMQTVNGLLAFLILWHGANGFSSTGAHRHVSAGASRRLRNNSLSPLRVTSTKTEEELREKLARNNEDLSEVRSLTSKCLGGWRRGLCAVVLLTCVSQHAVVVVKVVDGAGTCHLVRTGGTIVKAVTTPNA